MKFHPCKAAIALFVVASCASTLAYAAPVSGQGTWETTLQGRDLDGNPSTFEAYYDTDLDITWLADANYAGITMNWANANTWAATLNISGYTGWRLPTTTDIGNDGCNSIAYDGTDCGYNVDPATGEMAHMFYTTLGNKAYYDTSGNPNQPGWGLTNTAEFSNVEASAYWSGTEYAPNAGYAWSFYFNSGSQEHSHKVNDHYYAWAVQPGSVGAAVPEPTTAWLLGSGLLGLLGAARREAA